MPKKKPKKWVQVYAVGTKTGDEEVRFFRSLARHPKYDWRSVAAISRESALTKERVEQILMKYHKLGMVFQNPANEDQWGYWERVPHMLPDKEKSIAKQDQDSRIDKAMKEEDTVKFTAALPHVTCDKNGNYFPPDVFKEAIKRLNTQKISFLKHKFNLKTADELYRCD